MTVSIRGACASAAGTAPPLNWRRLGQITANRDVLTLTFS
jgi:hypothetical protein